jgi:hypothetical protein
MIEAAIETSGALKVPEAAVARLPDDVRSELAHRLLVENKLTGK